MGSGLVAMTQLIPDCRNERCHYEEVSDNVTTLDEDIAR